jgi:uncharacterized YigZ family protein
VSDPVDPDRYVSVVDGPEVELKVKGSRFLGRVFHARDAEQANRRLHALRKQHHSATHHCWAWRIGTPEVTHERFDDDGEPAGTAGRPILNQLLGADLYDAMVVVTRYFGGTKLGTGGLARAYGDAARTALDATERSAVRLEAELCVECAFDDVGTVEACLARAGSAVHHVEREYDPSPSWKLLVGRSRADEIGAAIVEATAGRGKVIRSRES